MNPIEVRGLNKSYDGVKAVRDVSFSVGEGSIFGLIGPDGGGKTTIIRTVVSLTVGRFGRVLFKGKPVSRNADFVRANIGYMPQRFSLYQDLTVEENLRFFGDLFAVPRKEMNTRIEELYGFSTLGPFRKRRAGALSGGMKQKLALSCMLVHQPSVIVLDEPTFGVDPVSRSDFWEILKTLAGRGTTILVSTAYMDEALLCDRVALVYRGEILAADTPTELRRHFSEPLYLAETDFRTWPTGRCTILRSAANAGFSEKAYTSRSPAGSTTEKVSEKLAESRAPVSGIRRIEPGLEDLFLKLMKE